MTRRRRQRTLATVLFTDIVGSSEIGAELGDRRWRVLLARHHAIVRRELRRYGGRELDTAGDGFFAAFDTQADAVRCACAVAQRVRELGIDIRVGLHVGESEILGEKLGGVAVNIGARVMALAGPGEVLVTGVLKDLVPGSGFEFADRGTHALKGIPGEWHVFAITAVDGERLTGPLDPAMAAERKALIQPAPLLRRRRVVVVAGAAILVATVVVVAVLVGRHGPAAHARTAPPAPPVPHVLLKLDSATGRILATIRIGDPGQRGDPFQDAQPHGVAVGEGSVWITNQGDDTVLRVNPLLDRVAGAIRVIGADGVAVGPGAVWVTSNAAAADVIDPGTNRAVEVGLPKIAIEPLDVAVDPDSGLAYVTSLPCITCDIISTASVTVIDRSGAVVGEPILLTGDFVTTDIAVTAGSVWVTAANEVWRIDPQTRKVLAKVKVGGQLGALTADESDSSVWVTATTSAGQVNDAVQIDVATNRIANRVPVGCCPGAIAAGEGYIWVTDTRQGVVSRISELAGEVQAPIKVGVGADGIAVGQGAVWITVDRGS